MSERVGKCTECGELMVGELDCLCDTCEFGPHKLKPWQRQVFLMLSAPMQCSVVLTGGTHITGMLERAKEGLRMVSPDNCPGYLPENAPSPTCERFFDYKDVVMVTRRLT